MPLLKQAIQQARPDLADELIQSYLDRLEPAYHERFSPSEAAEHLATLNSLSAETPVAVHLHVEGEEVDCAIFAFDHAFEFSLITGVMSGLGLRIESGEVFTLAASKAPARGGDGAGLGGGSGRGRLPARRFEPRRQARVGAGWRGAGTHRAGGSSASRPARDPQRSAVIVDFFRGRREPSPEPADAWSQRLREAITRTLTWLDEGAEASIERAKQFVNELVTSRLAENEDEDVAAKLLPVEIIIEQLEHRTRLRILGQDTPAFLYALSNALSLLGCSIQHVRIDGQGHRVSDQIDIVDARGERITSPDAIERIRLSVLLTKQFTYFLGRSPDPYTALKRFGALIVNLTDDPEREAWVDALRDRRTMQQLGRVLGASDYLWEDFIRGQYEALRPVLQTRLSEDQRIAEPAETIPMRIEQALEGAVGLAEQIDRLNRFKDDEIYRVDLDQILAPASDFRAFSQRLSLLAENLVTAAARLVYGDLTLSYGRPSGGSPHHPPYAVFGLGKLGGMALGYASDIELLFIYHEQGQTEGGKREPISNSEFFETLTRETALAIRTKRAGIFEVDLRLRPYGGDGPLASSRDQFDAYYEPQGAAHWFERLALVRLRWIAGDPQLGFEIEKLRDRAVYDEAAPDLDALWDIWTRGHAEKNKPGRLNAKHSPGALTDLEGAVQLLQVLHANLAPQLKTPRLSEALESLRRAGALDAYAYARIVGAYHYFRQLINALRMLRGNAQDLFLPDADAQELRHLARRMGYVTRDRADKGKQLLVDFQRHTDNVKAFIESTFGRPSPGLAAKAASADR